MVSVVILPRAQYLAVDTRSSFTGKRQILEDQDTGALPEECPTAIS